ncbi:MULTISPECIES: hypothetical protein [unclassified Marinitoga]|uniref:hypothetical protein n=1 Tax=unclassified Marinitoga TaxID=2640159 RepID=UPI000641009E|nr:MULTISPECIES: hypothetical protein [unclassified Marinitoga]NUU99008.1 hypothetical protein [Marinitoga sp. 1154]
MKKIIFIFILFYSIAFSQNLTDSEKMARRLFSESLNSFFSGKKYEARLKLEEAMSNQIYLRDVPYFWYFAAKLDLLLGNIEKAKEDLNNILFFSPSNTEAISLLNFINSLNNIEKIISPEIKIKEFKQIKNIINANEKYFMANDFLIVNSYIYLLDIQNKLIYYTNLDNSYENWIKFENAIGKDFIPLNIYYDERTDYFYVSGNTGLYVIKNFSLQKKFYFEKISKYDNLLLIGLDKVGRFWTYYAKNNSILILDYYGNLLEKIALDNNYIITNGSFSEEDINLIDIKNKQVLVFSTYSKKIESIIPLKNSHKPLNIVSLPYNIFLISFMNDGTYLYQNGKFIKLFDFSYLLNYNNGILMKFDYSSYKLILDQVDFVGDIVPYHVFLYGIDFDVPKMMINLKISTISPGSNFINFINRKIYITDSEGRYAFDYNKKLEKPRIYNFDNMEYLFLEMIPLLKNDSIIILNDTENTNYEKYINITNIIPFLFTNISLYLVSDKIIDKKFRYLINLTGGYLIPEEYLMTFENYIKINKKIIQNITYKIYPPIAPGIRPVKIYLQIDSKIMSDTMYYYSEGVGIAE